MTKNYSISATTADSSIATLMQAILNGITEYYEKALSHEVSRELFRKNLCTIEADLSDFARNWINTNLDEMAVQKPQKEILESFSKTFLEEMNHSFRNLL